MVFTQDTPESTATTFLGQANDLLISLWRDYPRLLLGPSLKLYYLSQTAFWVQQIFVINIEERRKDHWQMFTHHIVTVTLLVFSYGYRQMRAGNAVLVLMDVVDLIFPVCLIRQRDLLTLLTRLDSSPKCSNTLDASKLAMQLSRFSSSRGLQHDTSDTYPSAGASMRTSPKLLCRMVLTVPLTLLA